MKTPTAHCQMHALIVSWLLLVMHGSAATAHAQTHAEVAPIALQVQQVVLGADHTCARMGSGQVWCWGANDHGQLGNGSAVGSGRPVAVDGVADAVDVAAGDHRTCAVRRDGSVWCWGRDTRGELLAGRHLSEGKSRREAILQAESVPGVPPAVQVTLGAAHACARTRDGSVWCWGSDDGRARGMGTASAGFVPFQPSRVAGLRTVTALHAQAHWTCALQSDGTWCWGADLPTGSPEPSPSPVRIDASPEFAFPVWGIGVCRVARTADLWCRTVDSARSGPKLPKLPAHVADIRAFSAGPTHACFVSREGIAFCWGSNDTGQLGDWTTLSRTFPAPARGPTDLASVIAGPDRTCSLTRTGHLLCWGQDNVGQVGVGTRSFSSTPAPVAGMPPAVAVSAGPSKSCAIDRFGHLACWGSTSIATAPMATRPLPVSELRNVEAVTLGDVDCARLASATVRCRGKAVRGSGGTYWVHATEADVVRWVTAPYGAGGPSTSKALCTLLPDHALCASASPVSTSRVDDAAASLLEIATGADFACGRTQLGRVRCWGNNACGQLGDGTTVSASRAVEVPNLTDVVDLSAGPRHACARLADGGVRCWGDDRSGQLGRGRIVLQPRPSAVILPPAN